MALIKPAECYLQVLSLAVHLLKSPAAPTEPLPVGEFGVLAFPAGEWTRQVDEGVEALVLPLQ